MKLQNYNGFDRQLNYWIKTDKKVANKIKKLIDVIRDKVSDEQDFSTILSGFELEL